MRIYVALALAALILVPLGARAQTETVVVTGSRIHEEDEAPHLSITKRADHVITEVSVTCDTRELSQRRAELKETLRNMIRAAAGTSTISLGIGDKIVLDLAESNFDSIIEPDSRSDTSHAVVILKTRISKDDTYNAAIARIVAFVATVPKAGRTEILRQGSWGLTIVGPEQYRDAIVSQIVVDAKHTADLFGPGNAVQVEGLEHQVSWYQKGPLDLGLYIPYTLKILPAARAGN